MIQADKFLPFFGMVEDNNDPHQMGRVRVRCFGYHSPDMGQLPTDKLPWFSCITNNSSGVSGIGSSPTGYVTGATVFGFFINQTYQNGIVIGSLSGTPTQAAFSGSGFNDPSGKYPTYINESDVNRLARGDKQHWLFQARADARVTDIQKPIDSDNSNTLSEPAYDNAAIYPNNNVIETPSGHIIEYDDTPGHERIHFAHRTGTYDMVDEKGDKTIKVVGDRYDITIGNNNISIHGDVNLSVNGNVNEYIRGNYTRQIDGNYTEVIQGSKSELVKGDYSLLSQGTVAVDGNSVYLNSGKASGLASIKVTLPQEFSLKFATPVIKSAGRYAPLDDPLDVGATPDNYPPDKPPEGASDTPKQQGDQTDAPKDTPKDLGNCKQISLPLDYNTRLSPNYTIGSLSINALFSHRIVAQRGLQIQDIVCNLEALALNIIEPVRKQFGSFRINSGFRTGASKSQHNIGQAVDIQEPTWSHAKMLEIANWMAQNLPVDQLIFEHGNSIWIHASFDRNKSKQRGQLMTMIRGGYQSGLKLYY